MGTMSTLFQSMPPFASATYDSSPTLTIRCFSTSGLARQNQQAAEAAAALATNQHQAMKKQARVQC